MKRLLLVFFISVGLSAHAQLWSGWLNPTSTCNPFSYSTAEKCGIDWSKVGFKNVLGTGKVDSWGVGVVPTYYTGTAAWTRSNAGDPAVGYEPLGGTSDDGSNIQSRLTACAVANAGLNLFDKGSYVLLAPGTFLSNNSNVATGASLQVLSHCELRGSGAKLTKIKSSYNGPIITLGQGQSYTYQANSHPFFDVTSGYTVGSGPSSPIVGCYTANCGKTGFGGNGTLGNEITSANVSNGTQYIMISEYNYTPFVSQGGHQGGGAALSGATGKVAGLYISGTPGVPTGTVGANNAQYVASIISNWGEPGGSNGGFGGGALRVRAQIMRVTNYNNSNGQITTETPLYTDYSHTPPGWQASTYYSIGDIILENGYLWVQRVSPATTPYACQSGSVKPDFVTGAAVGKDVYDSACGADPVAVGNWYAFAQASTTKPQIFPFPMVVNAGVSDLTVEATAGYTSNSNATNIMINSCGYCWAAGIQSNFANGNHLYAINSYRPEIRDSIFSGAWYHGPGQVDQTILISLGTTEGLFENNTIDRPHTGQMFGRGATGNVIAYNYVTGQFDNHTNNTVTMAGFNSNHAPHPQFNLYEGNVSSSNQLDGIHGSSNAMTSIRNWYKGTSKICEPFLAYPLANPYYAVTGGVQATCTGDGVHTLSYPQNTYTDGSGTHWYAARYSFQGTFAIDEDDLNYGATYFGDLLGSTEANSIVSPNDKILPQYLDGASQAKTFQFLGSVADWTPGGACVTAGGVNQSCRDYTSFNGITIGFAYVSDPGTFALSGPRAATTTSLNCIYSNLALDSRGVSNASLIGGTCAGLPTSFYLAHKPDWWVSSGLPWPAQGPDISTGDTLNNHTYSTGANPAMKYYLGALGGADGGNNSPFSIYDPAAAYYSTTPSCTLSVTPTNTQYGTTLTFSGTYNLAESGTIDNGIGAVTLSSGSVSGSGLARTIASPVTYTLTVTGISGTGTCTATATVKNPTTPFAN